MANLAQKGISHGQTVKLVDVDRHVTLATVFPRIFLIDRYTHQMRHDLSKPVVMISFNPHHLNAMPWIGEFPDVSQKFPVFFCETAKIQVSKDIAQQDQPVEMG